MVSCGKCLHKEVCVDYRYYKPNAEKCLNFKEVNVVKTKQTNADRLRAMSDEELAVTIAQNTYTGACNDFGIPHKGKCCGDCEKCDAIIKWLQQPAE